MRFHPIVPSKILASAQPPARVQIACKCAKTAGQVLVDIAEQTATPVLVTYFEGVKKDTCS